MEAEKPVMGRRFCWKVTVVKSWWHGVNI